MKLKPCLWAVGVGLVLLAAPVLTLAAPPQQDQAALDALHLSRQRHEPIPIMPGAEQPLSPAQPSADWLDWTRIVAQYAVRNWDIFYFDRDHSDIWVTPLVSTPDLDVNPRLNSDASRMAYNHGGNPQHMEVYVIDVATRNIVQVTNNRTNNLGPVWSADSSRLAFASNQGGKWDIYTIRADGLQQTRLTFDSSDNVSPAWSPDGSRIAWIKGGNIASLWMMNADGSNQHVVLPNLRYLQNPVWSPDGQRLALDYDADGDGATEVGVVNADGSDLRLIYDLNGQAKFNEIGVSGWSPDGQYLLISSIVYGYNNGTYYVSYSTIYKIPVDGIGYPGTILGNLYANVDWKPVETGRPSSHVKPLPAVSPAGVLVEWSGQDTGPSGIDSYDVQVKDGAGAWTDLVTGTPLTGTGFMGQSNHTYYFRSRARDGAFNLEAWPDTPDAATRIENLPPRTVWTFAPLFQRGPLRATWNSVDDGGSGIDIYQVEQRRSEEPDWHSVTQGTTLPWIDFSGKSGLTYQFRVRGIDHAANVEAWSASNTMQTTFYEWGVTGTVEDAAGYPVPGLIGQLSPVTFAEFPNTTLAQYGLYALSASEAYIATWHSAGYGSLPATRWQQGDDARSAVVLPPIDNVVTNGHFEGASPLSGWQVSGDPVGAWATTSAHTGQFAAQWNGSSGVGYVQQTLYPGQSPAMVIDQAQTAHVIWPIDLGAGYTSIRYARKPLLGDWPIAPTRIITQLGALAALALAPDQSGALHVAAVFKKDVYYCRVPGPNAPCSALVKLTQMPGDDQVRAVQLKTDAAGRLHLAYATLTSVYYRTSSTGATWSTPELISPASDVRSLDMDFDAHETVHLTWTISQFSWDFQTYYTQKPAAHSWLTPTAVASGWTNSVFAVTPDGTAHLLWLDTSGLYAAHTLSDTTWSTTEQVSSGAGWQNVSAMRFDANGAGHALAKQGDVVWRLVREPGGSWLEVGSLDWNAGWPQLDNRNVAHEIYQDNTPRLYYRRSTVMPQDRYARLSQPLNLPLTLHHPIGSWVYRTDWSSAGSGLYVTIDNGITSTVVYSAAQIDGQWRHGWADLSAWQGQAVTLTLELRQSAGQPQVNLYVDEVSVGSWHTPIVEAASTGFWADAWATRPITITGQNFIATPTATLDDVPLLDLQWLDEHTLTAQLPGLPPGPKLHWLRVSNPGGATNAIWLTLTAGRQLYLPVITKNAQ